MASAPNKNILQYDWSKLDDVAWQQLLQEMNTGDYSVVDTSQSQGWHLDHPLRSQEAQGSDRSQTRHSIDANAGAHLEDPISPPSYQKLSSAEASPEKEPVPQAESYSDDPVLVEELRGLVDDLQREYVFVSRLRQQR